MSAIREFAAEIADFFGFDCVQRGPTLTVAGMQQECQAARRTREASRSEARTAAAWPLRGRRIALQPDSVRNPAREVTDHNNSTLQYSLMLWKVACGSPNGEYNSPFPTLRGRSSIG